MSRFLSRTNFLLLAIIALAALLRWALEWAFGIKAIYLTFYPAMVFSALLGGMGPGLLATVLSSLAASFFLPPIGSLKIEGLGTLRNLVAAEPAR